MRMLDFPFLQNHNKYLSHAVPYRDNFKAPLQNEQIYNKSKFINLVSTFTNYRILI